MNEISNFEANINKKYVGGNPDHKIKKYHDKKLFKKTRKSSSVEPSVENNLNKFERDSLKDNESVHNNSIIKEESSVYTMESRSRNNTKLPIINKTQNYQPEEQLKQNNMQNYLFRKNVSVNSNRSGSIKNVKITEDAHHSSLTNFTTQKKAFIVKKINTERLNQLAKPRIK